MIAVVLAGALGFVVGLIAGAMAITWRFTKVNDIQITTKH